MNNYVELAAKDGTAINQHFFECQRINRPMLMVKHRGKTASLEWDCVTIECADEDFVTGDRGDVLVEEMFEVFRKNASNERRRSTFLGSAFAGMVKNVEAPTARLLADEYSKLLRITS